MKLKIKAVVKVIKRAGKRDSTKVCCVAINPAFLGTDLFSHSNFTPMRISFSYNTMEEFEIKARDMNQSMSGMLSASAQCQLAKELDSLAVRLGVVK